MDEEQNTEHRGEHRAVAPADPRRDRRKYLLPQEHVDRVLEACRAKVPETQIAKALGINYRTWMRVRQEDANVSSTLAETRNRSLMDKERKLQAAVYRGLKHLGEPQPRLTRLQAAEQHADRVRPDRSHARVCAHAHVREAPGPHRNSPCPVHPDVLIPLAHILGKPGTAGQSVYNAGRVALAEMRNCYVAIHCAHRALRAGAPSLLARQLSGGKNCDVGVALDGPRGSENDLVGSARWAFNRATRTVDLRIAEMKAHASILQERLADAMAEHPVAAAADPLACVQEVRARLRPLPQSERLAIIARAIAVRGPRTVATVRSALPLQSGISSKALRTVCDQTRRCASAEHEQAYAIAKVIKRVMAALKLVASSYTRMLDLAEAHCLQRANTADYLEA